MLYDERTSISRIRENIGLTATCVARSGLIDRVPIAEPTGAPM